MKNISMLIGLLLIVISVQSNFATASTPEGCKKFCGDKCNKKKDKINCMLTCMDECGADGDEGSINAPFKNQVLAQLKQYQ